MACPNCPGEPVNILRDLRPRHTPKGTRHTRVPLTHRHIIIMIITLIAHPSPSLHDSSSPSYGEHIVDETERDALRVLQLPDDHARALLGRGILPEAEVILGALDGAEHAPLAVDDR